MANVKCCATWTKGMRRDFKNVGSVVFTVSIQLKKACAISGFCPRADEFVEINGIRCNVLTVSIASVLFKIWKQGSSSIGNTVRTKLWDSGLGPKLSVVKEGGSSCANNIPVKDNHTPLRRR